LGRDLGRDFCFVICLIEISLVKISLRFLAAL
jgi:hypothetical protein